MSFCFNINYNNKIYLIVEYTLTIQVLLTTSCYNNICQYNLNLTKYIIHFFIYRGTFRMEREDGHLFDCRIPPFSLESKPDDKVTFNTV